MTADEHAIRTVEQLLEVLDLDSTQARTTEDIFTGSSHPMPSGRIYGGQVLAQSLLAAERTLPEDRAVHSMAGPAAYPQSMHQAIESRQQREGGRKLAAPAPRHAPA